MQGLIRPRGHGKPAGVSLIIPPGAGGCGGGGGGGGGGGPAVGGGVRWRRGGVAAGAASERPGFRGGEVSDCLATDVCLAFFEQPPPRDSEKARADRGLRPFTWQAV